MENLDSNKLVSKLNLVFFYDIMDLDNLKIVLDRIIVENFCSSSENEANP